MADAAAGSERTPHKYNYTSALDVPTVSLLESNKVLQGHVLADLQFRIREVEAFKIQVDLLRAEIFRNGVQIAAHSKDPASPPAVNVAAAAGPVAGDALRIKELEDGLRSAVEGYKVDKSAWDAEKLVLEGRLGVSGDTLMVGAPSAKDDQTLRIDQLTDEVIYWRERYESRTSSTHSNTLHGLLRKLQIVLQLPYDDPDAVYVAVAKAIYVHSAPAQRREISDAPVYKDGFIDYLVDVFKYESSDAYESDAEVTDTSNADGIELADRPKSARRTPRLDSARAQTQNEKAGIARRAAEAAKTAGSKFKSVINRVRGISDGAKSDLSTLLRDLKHVSENDAYAPPI